MPASPSSYGQLGKKTSSTGIRISYLDQLDADRAAIDFLEQRAIAAYQRTPHVEIRWHNHDTDGRTGVLWIDGQPAAITVVLRNDLNRSVLVTHDLMAGSAHRNEPH